MRKPFAIILGFYLLAAPLSAQAQAQNARYVYDGRTLQAMGEDLAVPAENSVRISTSIFVAR